MATLHHFPAAGNARGPVQRPPGPDRAGGISSTLVAASATAPVPVPGLACPFCEGQVLAMPAADPLFTRNIFCPDCSREPALGFRKAVPCVR